MKDLKWIEDNIRGALYEGEGMLLHGLAKKCQGKGVIVEIGALLGKSTAYLALGSKAGANIRVYAIDPFNGGDSMPRSLWIKKLFAKGSFYSTFKENMRKAELSDIVTAIPLRSTEALSKVDEQIELLFVDGAHDYRSVRNDVSLYYPRVIPRGTIALHDRNLKGVNRVIREIVQEQKWVQEVETFKSISVCRKL
jgi:predicted O-methyltransferase YrrM